MTTLPGPKTIEFPADSLEKQVYTIAEELKDYLPVASDRNRLGYVLFKYVNKQGDEPSVMLLNGKFTIQGITRDQLASIITEKLKTVKLPE
ncbi:MAG: hypothetical protein HBSAPP04_04130 [Ignavibacteriaceae bacterium]|nr:MAG: hypothetical protein EDM75_05505 [Chlorobiota bacterium]GJQ31574.1 MAG: hypothetical protein HBSAPP04_04130 [Ignavibacteriaceae bacterium]